MLVDYQISQYLNYLVDAHLCTKATTSTWVHQLWVSLVPLWQILVGQFPSARTPQALQWYRGKDYGSKCLHDTYKGFEPTGLHQYAKMADALPLDQPLLAECFLSILDRKHLLPNLHKSIDQTEREGHRVKSCHWRSLVPSTTLIVMGDF